VAATLAAPNLKELIARKAREAGAGAVAFASAAPDATARGRLRASFARDDLATWPYDDAYAVRASDPATLLPGARTVICVALPYANAAPAPAPGRAPGTGRVSNYAWSADYHEVARAVLREIAAYIDALAGVPATRVVCDTAPLAERAFAARAGLGWIGKHTNLIVPGLGSYVFLGEIVTTLALEPDPPARKSCGSCARCIDVCPTRALRRDYTIDATRCISDLTQRTDAIPRDMRPLIGDWVWGCDLCQEICPPTRRAGLGGSAPFAAPSAEAARPDLQALLRLRAAEFKRRYRGTAMGWRGAAVLRRNAAVALGNGLDRSTVPALADALAADLHRGVRLHAAWALGRIGSPRALRSLRERLGLEADAEVEAEICHALAEWEPFSPAPALRSRRTDPR
jgi:epoxyqueuosine reductase